MAEAVFKHTVASNGLTESFSCIDSFGTAGYHVGEEPDHRSSQTCKKHGVPVDHRAQQLKRDAFDKFDFLIAMDDANLANIERLRPKGSFTKVLMFGEYNRGNKFNRVVDDPYYGGNDGFEYNFKQIEYFSQEFLKRELQWQP